VRASATSRISSAHLHAAQNKPDTNKADAASPFAILVQEAAPKDAAKAAHKDSSDDKKDADKPSAKTDKAGASTEAQAKPVQTASSQNKADKADKSDDKTIKADKPDDAAQDIDAAAAQDQAAAPRPVNPQIQQAAQPGAATLAANDDSADADEIAAAGQTQNTPAAQNNAPAAPAAEEDQAQDAEVAATNAPAAKPTGKPAKTDSAKTDTKTADIKAKADDAADNTATANAADTKTDAANAALNAKAAATQDASRPADTNHQVVNSLAAPQAQQPAQSAALTQHHVQVTAQPTPNVPALAVEIAAKSLSGAKQFDIRLDPPELGRVEVRLSIDATGKASAHLSADTPQTLDLLQKDAPALTRALREAGLDVSQDGLNFSLRHQGSQDSNANNSGSRGNGRGFTLTATNSIDATATSAAYRSVADGRLDIRV
jgi:flagellar hook-length control protein FliK